MKIALLGYGKMGKLVEQIALNQGHTILVRQRNEEKFSPLFSFADLAIDFSEASAVIPHLERCLENQIPMVIGTTGWDDSHALAKQLVEQANGTCLYGPNFSIGMYVYQQMISHAASCFEPLSDYAVAGVEWHHQQKKDAPSGTAKLLSKIIKEKMPNLSEMTFSSVRTGHIPGTHTVLFDSAADTITLTHEARNRDGFAKGAVLAAEWLLKQKGFFTFDCFMKAKLGEKKHVF